VGDPGVPFLCINPCVVIKFLQRDIYNNSVLLVELCVTKLEQDWFVLLDLLALVLNPNSK
jgi:hypothetical protein